MEIQSKKLIHSYYCDIKEGEAFSFIDMPNIFYMKIEKGASVNLRTGRLISVQKNKMVTKINAKVVVSNE